jgi:hypothetical protein
MLLKLIIRCASLIGTVRGFSVNKQQHFSLTKHPLRASEPSANDPSSPDNERRNILSLIVVAISAASLSSVVVPDLSSSSSVGDSTKKLASVDEAIQFIESSCDRRFLHAVVASDYQLMYRRGESAKTIAICNDPDTLLQSSSAQVFSTLEQQLQDRPLQPSNSRLAVSHVETAKQQWGTNRVVSVWPLGNNVHFAWPEEGSQFGAPSVIVDGVDCGRMSLEDALEGDKEILFRSDSYLAVPLSMEKELLSKLQAAFLI